MEMLNKYTLQPGQMIDSYQIVAELGRGGMGIVYKAIEKKLNRFVAIKMIFDQEIRSKKRFLREAELLSQLNHENIVKLYKIGKINDSLYIVMEYIEGTTLKTLIYNNMITPQDGVKILIEVAKALDYTHNKNIIHRDIKPENIMIQSNGVVKVMDFGVAKSTKIENGQLTKTGNIVGTPYYTAPELLTKNSKSPQLDIYSLGVVLYEIIAKKQMIEGKTTMAIWQNIQMFVPQCCMLKEFQHPKGLDLVWLKSVAPKKARYSTMQHLQKDLEKVLLNKKITKQKIIYTKKSLAVIVLLLVIFTFLYLGWQKIQPQVKENDFDTYFIAINKYNNRDYEDAYKIFSSLQTQNNNHMLFYYLGGCIYYLENEKPNKDYSKLEKATTYLEKAKEKFPNNINILTLLGKVYFATDNENKTTNYQKAKTYFEHCTHIEPSESEYYYYIAEIYFFFKEYDFCCQNLRKVFALQQGHLKAADLSLRVSIDAPYLQGDNWMLLANMFFSLKPPELPCLFTEEVSTLFDTTCHNYENVISGSEEKNDKFYLYLSAKIHLNQNLIASFYEHKEFYRKIFLTLNSNVLHRYLAAKTLIALNEFEFMVDAVDSQDIAGKIIAYSLLRKAQIPIFREEVYSYLEAIDISNMNKSNKEFLKVLLAESFYILNIKYHKTEVSSKEKVEILLNTLIASKNPKIKLAAAASITNLFVGDLEKTKNAHQVLLEFTETTDNSLRNYAYFFLLNSYDEKVNNFDYLSLYKKGLRIQDKSTNMLCLSFLHRFLDVEIPKTDNIFLFLLFSSNGSTKITNHSFLKAISSELLYIANNSDDSELRLQTSCLWVATFPDFSQIKHFFKNNSVSSIQYCMMMRFYMLLVFFENKNPELQHTLIDYIQKGPDDVARGNLYFIGSIFASSTNIKSSLDDIAKTSIINAMGLSVFSNFIETEKTKNREFLRKYIDHKNEIIRCTVHGVIINLLTETERIDFCEKLQKNGTQKVKKFTSKGLERFLKIYTRNQQDMVKLIHYTMDGLDIYDPYKIEELDQEYIDRVIESPKKEMVYRALNDAILLDPNNDMAHYTRAVMYMAQLDFAKAKSDFVNAISLSPENYRYWIGLAEVLWRLGETEKSQEYLAVALKQEQVPLLLDKIGSIYYEMGEYSKSCTTYKRLFYRYPYNKKYILRIVRSYLAEEKEESAILYLDWLEKISKRKYTNTKVETDLLQKSDIDFWQLIKDKETIKRFFK